MTFRALLFSLTFLLTACGGTVQDFVKDAKPPRPVSPPAPTPTPQSYGPMVLKASPGKFEGSGSGVAINATVTPTRQVYSAGDLAVSLSISRHRTSTDR